MEVTLIKGTNGKYELQYGIQVLANSRGIEEYKYVNLSETEVNKIRDAKIEEVQAILSKLY